MVDRITIQFPEKIHFSTDLYVRVGDINYANHLSHDRLITMIHEARMQFFEELGLKEYEPDGVGIVIADLGIQYLKEAFYKNRLTIDIAAPRLEKKGIQLVYRVSRRLQDDNTDKQELVALAKTGAVFFDYRTRRAATVPEGLADLIAQQEKRA
jgi:acyl-CoA thioesterase FadM